MNEIVVHILNQKMKELGVDSVHNCLGIWNVETAI